MVRLPVNSVLNLMFWSDDIGSNIGEPTTMSNGDTGGAVPTIPGITPAGTKPVEATASMVITRIT